MVVQLSSVDPLTIRELKAAAGKYAYSSRIKWLHIDDKTLADLSRIAPAPRIFVIAPIPRPKVL